MNWFLGLLQIALIVLKIMGYFTYSWTWVFIPLYIYLFIILGIFIITAITAYWIHK